MDQEQIDQEQAIDEFNAGFNSVNSPDDTPEEKEVVADPVETEEPKQEPAEEKLYAGMTEAQIQTLIERSARVDSFEDQLRKAHGKIGELNGTLQELKASQTKPTHTAPALEGDALSEFEEQYPEFVAYADQRARAVAAEMLQGNQPVTQEDIKTQLQQEFQLGIMDAVYPDWRDTVNTPEFAGWLTTQSTELQQTYATTWNAKELGSVIAGFKTSQKTLNDRATKSKQRLSDALVPDGNQSKVSHAPTAQDEFLAGFNSVRGQR